MATTYLPLAFLQHDHSPFAGASESKSLPWPVTFGSSLNGTVVDECEIREIYWCPRRCLGYRSPTGNQPCPARSGSSACSPSRRSESPSERSRRRLNCIARAGVTRRGVERRRTGPCGLFPGKAPRRASAMSQERLDGMREIDVLEMGRFGTVAMGLPRGGGCLDCSRRCEISVDEPVMLRF